MLKGGRMGSSGRAPEQGTPCVHSEGRLHKVGGNTRGPHGLALPQSREAALASCSGTAEQSVSGPQRD